MGECLIPTRTRRLQPLQILLEISEICCLLCKTQSILKLTFNLIKCYIKNLKYLKSALKKKCQDLYLLYVTLMRYLVFRIWGHHILSLCAGTYLSDSGSGWECFSSKPIKRENMKYCRPQIREATREKRGGHVRIQTFRGTFWFCLCLEISQKEGEGFLNANFFCISLDIFHEKGGG